MGLNILPALELRGMILKAQFFYPSEEGYLMLPGLTLKTLN